MNIQGMVDKRNTFLLFGCYCHNPKLILDDKYTTTTSDYFESFHKMIFGAISNIAKKGNVSKISAIEIENEISLFKTSIDLWNVNRGAEYIENAIEETEDKIYNIGLYRDAVRKFSILRHAVNTLGLNINFVYEPYDELDVGNRRYTELQQKMEAFNRMSSNHLLAKINEKYNEFRKLWGDAFDDNYSFKAGDGITDRLQEHKNQDNAWGYPYQSGFLTTVFRGMRSKKFVIRSSISGGGKSRSSMADAVNIASDKIYDWNRKKWLSTGEKQPVLFISTELTKEEIQDCLLAHVSGIDEDRIATWDNITQEEELILNEAVEVVKDSLLFGEYMPDFTIDSINEKIEEYILNENITHAFFDYINDSPSLYQYYIEKTGVRLQTHQILFLFSAALKRTANRFNIFLGSSTQVSSNWKEEKDSNALKGSKAIIEKADGGMLALPITNGDLKKLKPVLDNGFYEVPNFAYYIFKNRGGRWNSIIVWTKLNLGTVREKDCFVTNNNFELIVDIEKTLIDFQMEDVGQVVMLDGDSISDAHEFITQLNETKL